MGRSSIDVAAVEAGGMLWIDRDAHGRRAMLTEILAQVSHDALQGEGLDAVLQAIVDCLVQRLPVAVASIILLNDAGTHFVQEVGAGGLNLDVPSALPWLVTVGAAGRCARTGQAQLITDVACDPDYVVGNPAVRSEYLIPIRHRNRPHGVLNLESTRADFFTPEVCTVFDAVAGQVAGAIHLARLARELEIANRRLHALSMSDGLTGIANHRCFDQQMAAEWRRLAREGCSLALLLVDADFFKALNDARSHLYGDECLRELACLCSASAPDDGDLVARYGGDELVILLPGRGLDQARCVAEDLRSRIGARAMPHPASAAAAHVTASIGAGAMVPPQPQSHERLIATADRALYLAKAGGRDRVVAIDGEGDAISDA